MGKTIKDSKTKTGKSNSPKVRDGNIRKAFSDEINLNQKVIKSKKRNYIDYGDEEDYEDYEEDYESEF